MYSDPTPAGTRVRAAIPVIAVHALMALVQLRGLDGTLPAETPSPLRVIDLPPAIEPQPEPPPPPGDGAARELREADPQPEGAASPPNLKSEPTPVVAPEQVLPAPAPPPPVAAAPLPGIGSAPSAGAAPVQGPGTGSGGIGTGRGSGGAGLGGGGGGGGGGDGGMPAGRLTPPRHLAGELSIRDMPESLRDGGFRGRVGVLYRVETDGRVTSCQVTSSSGSRLLDQTTCRLIERRFRFRPALDRLGRPFWSRIEETHEWESEFSEPPPRRRRGW